MNVLHVAFVHFEQVPAELCFYWFRYGVERQVGEDDLVELRHHGTFAEIAKRSAGLATGTLRVFAGEVCKELAAFNFFFQLFSMLFGLDENVAGIGSGHGMACFLNSLWDVLNSSVEHLATSKRWSLWVCLCNF